MLSKETKTRFLDWLENTARRSPLSPTSLGMCLRTFHMATPVVMMLMVLCAPYRIAVMFLIYMIWILVMFILFQGCFLTMLEQRIFADNFTIADPILELAGLDKTQAQRMRISYIVGGNYTLVLFAIFIARFYL